MGNLRTAAHSELAPHRLVAFGAEQLLAQSRFEKEVFLFLKMRLSGKPGFRRIISVPGLT
jgi:hypothetical protein